jgi:hypothetical protein
MPVVGYLILLNQQVLDFGDIDGRFRIFTPDVPWRLLLVYYGTLCLGLGSMLYSWRCPGRIRRYETAVDYAKAESEFFSEREHADHLERDLIQQVSQLTKEQQKYAYLEEVGGIGSVVARPTIVIMLTHHWNAYDITRPRARLLVYFLFWLGFCFLAVPTAVTLWGVIAYTMRIMGVW